MKDKGVLETSTKSPFSLPKVWESGTIVLLNLARLVCSLKKRWGSVKKVLLDFRKVPCNLRNLGEFFPEIAYMLNEASGDAMEVARGFNKLFISFTEFGKKLAEES